VIFSSVCTFVCSLISTNTFCVHMFLIKVKKTKNVICTFKSILACQDQPTVLNATIGSTSLTSPYHYSTVLTADCKLGHHVNGEAESKVSVELTCSDTDTWTPGNKFCVPKSKKCVGLVSCFIICFH